MTIFTRTLLVATIVAGASLASTTDVHAGCGGFRRSILPAIRARISYAQRPVYRRPAPAPCTQPTYHPSLPPVQQQVQLPTQPVQGIQQPFQQQPNQQQPFQQQPNQQQPFQQQPNQQQPFQQQPNQQQPFQQQPNQQQGQLSQTAQQRAPQSPAASQTAPQTTQPQTGTNTASANSAQLTALQALAGMSASQAPAQPQRPSNQVGTWNAKLSTGARVQLRLQADGSFSWSATNQTGRTSSFSGSYTISGGSLTLIRSNDNQKLAGVMTQSDSNSFNFKLAGAKDNGLSFVRA